MPDNDIIKILNAATYFVIAVVFSIVLLVRFLKNTLRKAARNRQMTGSEMEAQLLKTQLELQEQTLQHISQEIHDNIGQALTFVKLNTKQAGRVERADHKSHTGFAPRNQKPQYRFYQ
jgi:two-component system, NarL family, sensor kinase